MLGEARDKSGELSRASYWAFAMELSSDRVKLMILAAGVLGLESLSIGVAVFRLVSAQILRHAAFPSPDSPYQMRLERSDENVGSKFL